MDAHESDDKHVGAPPESKYRKIVGPKSPLKPKDVRASETFGHGSVLRHGQPSNQQPSRIDAT